MDSIKKICCQNCGAEIMFSPGTQLLLCNFCGSEFQIESATDSEVKSVSSILPFSTTANQFEIAALKWLSEGDYTPDDILEGSLFNNQVGMYLPMWLFNGKYDGEWSASSGYDRIEEYWDKSYDGKKLVKKTRTVTDWRPSNGNCKGKFTFLATASNESSVPRSVKDFSHGVGFEAGELKEFKIEYTQGFSLIELELDSDEAWNYHGESQANNYVELQSRKRIPGDRYKDFYVNAVYDIDTKLSCYVPFWLRNYKYKDSEFYLYMDGTNVLRLDGVRPKDEERESIVSSIETKRNWGCGGFFVLGLLLFYALLDSDEDAAMGVMFGAMIVGLIFYYVQNKKVNTILEESKKVRQEKLAAKIQSIEANRQDDDMGGVGKNKYSKLSQSQMLEICTIINPSTEWSFHQKLDNDGIGTDLTFEFLSTDESIVQFNIHQPPNDAIRCYLKGNMDNDEVPFSKMKQIENYLNDVSGSNQGGSQPKSKNTSSSNNPSF
ncbi:MAG: hypothetical protein CMB32_02165 [Euryarchaeota archaeon]|nr:hypothetical protein [Euryarchaeota archaeon]|tara:strand:+ start:1107 stop:2582 length:1476 start_codon:yes stop_codon:yes gene_type:complete